MNWKEQLMQRAQDMNIPQSPQYSCKVCGKSTNSETCICDNCYNVSRYHWEVN